MTRAPARRPIERGVVLLALLLFVALLGIFTMLAAQAWGTALQREREAELLFAGDQYRTAIRRYYFAAPPGQARQLPASIDELLEDRRFPVPVRHLRRAYAEPVSGGDWTLVMSGGRIAGVHSPSDAAPLKRTRFAPVDSAFEGLGAYRDWTFTFVPPSPRKR